MAPRCTAQRVAEYPRSPRRRGYYTTGPSDASQTIVSSKGVWRVEHGGARDRYLSYRVGLRACEASFTCVHGTRAPALNFQTARCYDGESGDAGTCTNTCGGDDWKITGSLVGTPNDAVKTSVKSGNAAATSLFTASQMAGLNDFYEDNQDALGGTKMSYVISVKVDTDASTLPVNIKATQAEADLFDEPEYVVRDSVAGVGLFEYPPTTGSAGVLKLVNGKAAIYDKDAKGMKTRTLTVTARRRIKGSTSYIKTRKACTVTVTVTNSNDRPWIPKNQERSIEENSIVETLVQTPVAAKDFDEGQSFEYQLLKTMDKNGAEITASAQKPFSIGKCSGIYKVEKDVLRFRTNSKYTTTLSIIDVDKDDDDFALAKCKDKSTPEHADYSKTQYCQKVSEEVDVTVLILNKNDAPTVSDAENTDNLAFTVPEDAALGTTVNGKGGVVRFSDADIIDDPSIQPLSKDDTHTFKIVQTDDHDAFSIDENSGTLKVKRALNFEDKKEYDIKIRITDSGGWKNEPEFIETWVKITVQDKNDAPVLDKTLKAAVDETDSAGETVVVLSDAWSDEDASSAGDLSEWTFVDNPRSGYKIVANSAGKWELQTNKKVDFEAFAEGENIETVRVTATDDATGAAKLKSAETLTITVTIQDVNEAPVLNDYSVYVMENLPKRKACVLQGSWTASNWNDCKDDCADQTNCAPSKSGLGTYDMVDRDQAHTFSIQSCSHTGTNVGAAVEDNDENCKNLFSIDGKSGEISSIDSLDRETMSIYDIVVKVVDDESTAKSDTATVKVHVLDAEEAPFIKEDWSPNNVPENAKNGDIVDHIHGIDPDKDQGIWSDAAEATKDDKGTDAVDESMDAVGAKTDFKSLNAVGATDDKKSKKQGATMTFTILSGNDDNIFGVHGSDKGHTGDDTVGELYIKDASKLDFEETAEYKLKIRTSQAGDAGLKTEKIITVKIDDANDKPEISNDEDGEGKDKGSIKRTVNEETSDGSKVGKVIKCTDPDESDKDEDGGCTATCTVTDVQKKDGTSVRTDSDHVLTKTTTSWDSCVTGGGDASCFTMNGYQLETKGDLPTIPSIDGNPPETVTVYVEIQCTDTDGAASESKRMIVEIEPVNDAPVIKSKKFYLFENPKEGTKIGEAMGATDEEVDMGFQKLKYSITKGNNKGYFKISESSGQISVKKGDDLDYEEKYDEDDKEAKFVLTVNVEDDDAKNPQSDEAEVTIILLDVNEKPDLVKDWKYEDLKEDTAVGSNIGGRIIYDEDGTRKKTDPEGETDQTLSFITGNDDGFFAIDQTSGQITIAKKGLDYETKKEFTLTVRVEEPIWDITMSDYRGNMWQTKSGAACQRWDKQTPREHDYKPDDSFEDGKYNTSGLTSVKDGDDEIDITQGVCRDPGGDKKIIWCYTLTGDETHEECETNLKAEIEVTIKLLDVNEPPTLKAPKSDINVYEDDNDEKEIGKPFVGEDKDSGDSVTYELTDDAGGRFSIDANTGQLKIKDASKIDYETDKKHVVKCKVKDSKGLYSNETSAEIKVKDVNEKPTTLTITTEADGTTDKLSDVGEDMTEKDEDGKTRVIATLSVGDVDEGDSHTCKIVSGNDNDAFGLHETDFTMYVRNESALDFEAGKTEYKVEVECEDEGGLSISAQTTLTILDINEPPTVEDVSFRIKENAAAELYLSDGDEVVVKDVDEKGDVSSHVVRIVDGDPSELFEMDGAALKIRPREWLYKAEEDAEEYEPPAVVTATGGAEELTVDCGDDSVISFGFGVQSSQAAGLNYAGNLVLKGARHVGEAAEQLDMPLTSSSLSTLTLGMFDNKRRGFVNGDFGAGMAKTISQEPKSWDKSGTVTTVSSGDADWNAKLVTPGKSAYYVSIGANSEYISQDVEGLPSGERVTMKAGFASKDGATSVEVHVEGLGRVFPPSGGIKNSGFIDGTSVNRDNFKYMCPAGWQCRGSVVVGHSCNTPWGSLCTKSGASHYMALQGKGAAAEQEIEGLPKDKEHKLVFFAACRPGYYTDATLEKLKVTVVGDKEYSFTADRKTLSCVGAPATATTAGATIGRGGFTRHTITFKANSDTNAATIKFQNAYDADEDRTVFVDSPTIELADDAASTPRVPFSVVGKDAFKLQKFSFIAPEGSPTTIKIVNSAPTDGAFASDPVLVDAPSLSWDGSPGATADANIEFGTLNNDPMAVSKLIVSPVSGRDNCGPIQLERCGDWDFATSRCNQYHTVATFEQGAEYELPDAVALDSQRWRVSPLTTLPVDGSGYRCAGTGTKKATATSARACEAECSTAGATACAYFSWSSVSTEDQCILFTTAECDAGQTAGSYVTYKMKADYRALDFRTGEYKYVSVDTGKAMHTTFSTSMWVKFTGDCDAQGICRLVSKPRKDGTGWNIAGSGGKISFGGMATPTAFWGGAAPSAYTTGVWYHVAATFAAGKYNLYIDGTSVASGTAFTGAGTTVSTDAAQPLVLGREWDEQSSGWTSSDKNLLSGRTAANTRMMGVAAWDGVALSAAEVQAIYDGTTAEVDTQASKLAVYLPGVDAAGKVQSKGISPAVTIRQHNQASSAPTIATMDAAEDAPSALASASAVPGAVKSCGMTLSVLAGTSASSACLLANNKHCTPGEQTCTLSACDTPGGDEKRLWAVCQPKEHGLLFAATNAVSCSVSGGKGQDCACPAKQTDGSDTLGIALGFAFQHSNDLGGETCPRTNTKACTKGESTCNQAACNTPGNDIQTIVLLCAGSDNRADNPGVLFGMDAMHKSPIAAATGGAAAKCAAGVTGMTCNDMDASQEIKCPNNAQVLFGFGLHFSSKVEKAAQPMVRRNNGLNCGYTKRACALPFARDSAGDDVTFLYAACAVGLDYESSPKFDLTVEATDPGGLTGRAKVTVTVDDRNEQPRVYDQTIEVPENSPVGKRVGSPIVAVDADEDDTLRYSVTGGDGASIFDVGSCDGQVSIKKAEVDYETQKTYTLKVTVTDDGENPDMLTDSAEITILVTDVNEPPRVSDYTCVFPEADDAARREAASIRLSGGENELMGVLEYRSAETGKWGPVCSGANWDAADKKNVQVACRQLGLTGGVVLGTAGTSYAASFGDEGPVAPTLGYSAGFQCAAGTELNLRACGNFADHSKKVADYTCAPEDGLMISCTYDVKWSGSDCKMGAQVTDDDNVGQAAVGSWSIVGGNMGSPWPLFAIDPNSGTISVSEKATAATRSTYLNYEAFPEHRLIARFTDMGGKFGDGAVYIRVANVKEPPYFLENPIPQARYIDENSLVDAPVGLPVQVWDQDENEGATLKVKLTNSAGGKFKFDPETGQVSVAQANKLDFEGAANEYTIAFEITDSSGETTVADVPVKVRDLNEPPTGTVKEFWIREDADPGTLASQTTENGDGWDTVQALTHSDVDSTEIEWGQATYEIVKQTYEKWDNDANKNVATECQVVRLDGASLGFALTSTAGLNFEKYSDYQITVRVTDGGGLTDEYQVDVKLVDVNESPKLPQGKNAEVDENSDAGTVIFTVEVDPVDDEDEEKIDVTIQTVTNGGAKYFSLANVEDSNDVRIEIAGAGAPSLDYEYLKKQTEGVTFLVMLKAVDRGIVGVPEGGKTTQPLDDFAEVKITVKDINEAPEFPSGEFVWEMPEDEEKNANIGQIVATDEDDADSVSYSITTGGENNMGVDNWANNGSSLTYIAPNLNLTVPNVFGIDASGTIYLNKYWSHHSRHKDPAAHRGYGPCRRLDDQVRVRDHRTA